MKKLRPAQLAWIGQAALIVLPVVILSAVALHFLREDKASIEQDAKNRAYALGPEVARQIGEQIAVFLSEGRKKNPFPQGELVNLQPFAVPDYARWPTPAGWVAELPPHKAQLWQAAMEARYQHPNAAGAAQAFSAITGLSNPAPMRANAQLSLLIASEPQGDRAALVRQAVRLAQEYPEELTESGTQVTDAALLLALRNLPKGDPPQDLVSAIEQSISLHPSFLSTYLIDTLAGVATTQSGKDTVARLRGEWQQQESARESVRSLVGTFGARLMSRRAKTYPYSPVASLLLYSDGENYDTEMERVRMAAPPARQGLALCFPEGGDWRLTFVRAEPLRRALHPTMPDYMGASLNLNGERWELGDRRAGTFIPLAWADGSFSLHSKYPFQLILDLRNSEALYAPYRRRLLLTQGLILSAVLAALLGLWRLWHTYRDQTRLNELKSNLVSSVSHELRAPLAAVRLMAESLESGRVDGAEKQKDYYRLIVRECRRLSSLVENVLDFSRIDQGRKQYYFEPLDALALVRHTVMLMEPGATERQVRLRLVDPPLEFESLQPSWDSEAVEQSMVNLLDNAIKHSPAGAEVLVEVELLPAFVRFWVIDSGPGIPVEEQQKIFDLFYRYGSELRRETEGVGIGLSIVKHVAEAHGGRVLVESAPGQGSRFGLELPR